MKAPAHFFQLRTACVRRITAYHKDLLVHDRREIRSHPGTPFLHLARDFGTYLTLLIPATAYPPQGEQVRYLFGHADRWHILKQITSVQIYHQSHHPDALLHYFDGKILREISHDQAKEITRLYTVRISNEFVGMKLQQAA